MNSFHVNIILAAFDLMHGAKKYEWVELIVLCWIRKMAIQPIHIFFRLVCKSRDCRNFTHETFSSESFSLYKCQRLLSKWVWCLPHNRGKLGNKIEKALIQLVGKTRFYYRVCKNRLQQVRYVCKTQYKYCTPRFSKIVYTAQKVKRMSQSTGLRPSAPPWVSINMYFETFLLYLYYVTYCLTSAQNFTIS